MQQKNLFGWEPDPPSRYPAVAGSKADGPSAEAATKVASSASRLRCAVLTEIIRGRSGTADEIAVNLGRSALAVRPRLSELRAAGLIEDTGHRRKNESGMSASVWRATGAGFAAARERGLTGLAAEIGEA
jgi:predicted ArsR family transcriptional regulator